MLAGRERCGDELRDLVHLPKVGHLACAGRQWRTRLLAQTRAATVLNEVAQTLHAVEAAGLAALGDAEHGRPERRVQLCVLRHEDQLFDRHVLWVNEAAIAPRFRDAFAPAILEEGQVSVGSAKQQYLGLQRVTAREHAQVLQHDGVGQRVQHLVLRDARLDQVYDVRLGEHTALRGDVV